MRPGHPQRVAHVPLVLRGIPHADFAGERCGNRVRAGKIALLKFAAAGEQPLTVAAPLGRVSRPPDGSGVAVNPETSTLPSG